MRIHELLMEFWWLWPPPWHIVFSAAITVSAVTFSPLLRKKHSCGRGVKSKTFRKISTNVWNLSRIRKERWLKTQKIFFKNGRKKRVKSEKEMCKMKKKEEIPRSSGGSARGRTVGDGRGAAHDATSSITVSWQRGVLHEQPHIHYSDHFTLQCMATTIKSFTERY